jgi:hypothetical protein
MKELETAGTELEAAGERVCRAILSEDLDQVASALRERSRLLRAGAEPTVLAFTQGEEAARLLCAFKQKLAAESVRREQLLHFDWRE